MLRPNSHADEAGAQPARQRCGLQLPHEPGESPVGADLPSDYGLHALSDPGRELAAALYFRQVASVESPFAECSRQYIGRRDRILDGKVDPDASDRRHGMSRISDAKEPRTIPPLQTVDFYF